MIRRFVEGAAQGPVIVCEEPLSFWGGVDPATARVIDAHHPLRGACLAGAMLMMPTSRGSCSGSGALLDMILNGRAPAALIFSGEEDVLTLGAEIAAELYRKALPVLRVEPGLWRRLARETTLTLDATGLHMAGESFAPDASTASPLALSAEDQAFLDGRHGEAAGAAMRVIARVAARQGAERLIDVTRVHIDGCIYASPANLAFAEDMAVLGAHVRVPTTTNAISVDRENWRGQGVDPAFGGPAARLADAYVRMGCAPSFTCSPYLLEPAPRRGEVLAWSESNAVLFANSVLGARSAKHPDFLDLCIALTGRAPLSGPYLDAERRARRVLEIAAPEAIDDSFWPLVGYLAGRLAPDRIPLLTGLERTTPSRDDLKALCAAFGSTSAAPMLHIAGVTPEAGEPAPGAEVMRVGRDDLAAVWRQLHEGPEAVDLVAIGSPHASLEEARALADAFAGRRAVIPVILTAGRDVLAQARSCGVLSQLEASGVRALPDLCWCSISEPVFPPQARVVLTNSGKYAHYGPGLSGRSVRFGRLADCINAALSGRAPWATPLWLM